KAKYKDKRIWKNALPSILQSLPIIGTVFKYIKFFLKIPCLDKKFNFIENNLYNTVLSINHELHLTKNHISTLEKEIFSTIAKIDNLKIDINNLSQETNIKINNLNEHINNISLKLNHIDHVINQLTSAEPLSETLEQQINYNIEKNLPLYISFENLFRGDEQSVIHRQERYLNYLKPSTNPVLDIGCGRGEFLKLLLEKGINVLGIEIDENLVEILKSQDLPVVKSDAIEFLQNTQQTFSNITAFHVIEHLSEENQQKLIKLSYEKLEPDGKLIIETPNPLYIKAFATFYLDTTHQKPIPPQTLAFLMQYYGFKNIKLLYLHPDRKEVSPFEEKEKFYMDYALIGEK
ncbi:class I SAM-dependent methyltransferase, partial [Hydrogenivirga sp. 128-5-R1-1]|uniref:class I SAM-dependent methyltransferase n=1 Tax=Hydrogenivirga sp. 128-5-R1-1 TaxID=392423 RepID=UPI00015EFC3A